MFEKILTAAGALGTVFSLSTAVLASDPVGVDPSAPIDKETGIRLSSEFQASVFADGIGPVRHITAGPGGWMYGALRLSVEGNGVVALKDTDGDGSADDIRYFGPGLSGTGIHYNGDHLYFGTSQKIVRWSVTVDTPIPSGEGELIVSGFPVQRAHNAKPMAFDGKGYMYVNVGVPSNTCMEKIRTKGSPGQRPCPELENHGGIYRFATDKPDQDFKKDGYRYSTGHRNANAVDWNTYADALFLVQHGRDQLGQFFPELYPDDLNAELPAEEFHRVDEGSDLGWPYSYYDHRIGERMVNPEYGGDGKTVSDHGQKPILAFPGHWAPNDLLFLRDSDLPKPWQTGR